MGKHIPKLFIFSNLKTIRARSQISDGRERAPLYRCSEIAKRLPAKKRRKCDVKLWSHLVDQKPPHNITS